jgi:predicted dithiol-disulfide oxidoreductase (DUF899 family)
VADPRGKDVISFCLQFQCHAGNPLVFSDAVRNSLLIPLSGTDVPTYHRDRPGMSAFAFEDGVIFHTYSTYARGLDVLWGVYQWLDRAPKGRNEHDVWWRRHDEYAPS